MGKVMVMLGGKLTSKGQTTIPKEIGEYLGLRVGDRVKHLFLRCLTNDVPTQAEAVARLLRWASEGKIA